MVDECGMDRTTTVGGFVRVKLRHVMQSAATARNRRSQHGVGPLIMWGRPAEVPETSSLHMHGGQGG